MKIRAFYLCLFFSSLLLWVRPIEPPPVPVSALVKIDESGTAISPWQGPWHCVYDKKTRLLWEVKTDDEGQSHYSRRYSWFVKTGASERGRGHVDGCFNIKCDTQTLIDALNRERRCGQSDWRLPTSDELLSIVDRNQANGLINPYFFPHNAKAVYWSADLTVSDEGGNGRSFDGAGLIGDIELAIAVDFSDAQKRVALAQKPALTRLVSDRFAQDIRLSAADERK